MTPTGEPVGVDADSDPPGASSVDSGRTVTARSHSGNRIKGSRMSDKSPRQKQSAKSGKSIKEKRAEKRAKAASDTSSSMEKLTHKKH
jgi:hypothetical protein